MATAYTERIINGTVKTFPEFAKLCMRAMGVSMHMRDEPLDVPYTPKIKESKNSYYKDSLEASKVKLETLNKTKDSELVKDSIKRLKENIRHHSKVLTEKRIALKKLHNILTEVHLWVPPTEEHQGIKKFMLDQINETISWEFNLGYYEDTIKNDTAELKKVNANKIRKRLTKQYKEDIKYYQKHVDDETNFSDDSEVWVEKFLNSLPK